MSGWPDEISPNENYGYGTDNGDDYKTKTINECSQKPLTKGDIKKLKEHVKLRQETNPDLKYRFFQQFKQEKCREKFMEDIEKEETEKQIEKINQMSQYDMASLWRFAPSGHPYFDKTKPFFKIFEKRFNELGGFTPGISKSLGW